MFRVRPSISISHGGYVTHHGSAGCGTAQHTLAYGEEPQNLEPSSGRELSAEDDFMAPFINRAVTPILAWITMANSCSGGVWIPAPC